MCIRDRKKALYLEYRKAQQDMRELVAVKGSVDHLRGLTDNQRNNCLLYTSSLCADLYDLRAP